MPSPRQRALFLARRKYPMFTEKMGAALDVALQKHKGKPDTDPLVVSDVWEQIRAFDGVRFSEPDAAKRASALKALTTLIDNVQACQAELIDNPTVANELYREVRRKQDDERDARQAHMEDYMPFSEADCEANFTSWKQETKWLPEEAVALTLGKEPTRVTWETIRRFKARSPFVREYRRRLDQLSRAINVGDLQQPLRPKEVLQWAKRQGWKVASELTSTTPGDVQNADASDDVHHLTRDVFYAVLLGSAIQTHGLEANYEEIGESTAFASLAACIQNAGLPANVKTLRKHTLDALAWARRRDLKLRYPKRKASEPR